MKKYILLTTALGVFILVAGTASAGQLTIPNSFTSGTTASASEMDANFAAVETAVDDNATRISAIESTGADITGVTAGSGLTGGATSGNATVSVGTGTITGTHIASSTITDVDILDEPGIDYVGGMNYQVTSLLSRIGTGFISLTAPTSGYIHLTFTGYTYQYSNTRSVYGISYSSTCSSVFTAANTGNQNLSFSGVNYNGFAMHYVTWVNAGTVSIYPCGLYYGTGTAPYIQNGVLTAVFYSTTY